ncbi:hypothetical protein GF312_02125 [Candidatus Poribacteria bacterium]|nr:hypothetical protein [Candidatus Poribacteria bacterium]
MADQDIVRFLSNRIDCLETRFETRFDRLERRLDHWMGKNGQQNVSIQKNSDQIDAINKMIDHKSKKSLTISVAVASCIATLLSALIQLLTKCIF